MQRCRRDRANLEIHATRRGLRTRSRYEIARDAGRWVRAIGETGAVTSDDASPDAGFITERRFGWSNLFVAPEEDPRNQVPSDGERATLIEFLTAYRQTLELKCQGLDAEQLARRSVPPSNLSLLGLVRHMPDVERYWFRQVLAAEDAPRRYRTPDDRDGDFNGAIANPATR